MDSLSGTVLHVITTLNRGGAEGHLSALVSEQLARGWKVHVAYLLGDGYWASALEQRGVEVRHLELRRYGELGPAWRLRRFIRDVRPDLIHAHLQPAELYTRLALLGSEAPPMIASKHVDRVFYEGPGSGVMARWVARRTRAFIAISSAVLEFLVEQEHLPRDRFTVIHYGIDPRPYDCVTLEQTEMWRRRWGVTEQDLVIGTLCRFEPQKALHVLIEAFSSFLSSVPERRARLILVGRGSLESQLKEQVQRLGLSDHVVFAGFHEDVPAIMSALDVFALTSDYEGFGLVLLEAMAARRPIVATRSGAIPEVVGPNGAGILVKPRDPSAVAAALQTLLDESLRAKVGLAGRRRMEEQFTLPVMGDRTIDLYRRVLRS